MVRVIRHQVATGHRKERLRKKNFFIFFIRNEIEAQGMFVAAKS